MVFEKLKQIVTEKLRVPADKILLSSDIVKDLGADSLDIVEMLMDVETEFDIVIDDDAITSLKTVGDVVNYVEAHAAK